MRMRVPATAGARSCVLATTVFLAAAACGSTVPGSLRPPSQPGGSGPLSGVSWSPNGSGAQVPLSAQGQPPPAATTSTQGKPGEVQVGAPPQAIGSPSSSLRIPGASNGYLSVGYIHVANYGQAQQAAGQAGLGGVNDQQVITALAQDLNARGGIHGLKIKLVPFTLDATDQTTTSAQWQQQECTTWTQDSRVFAAFVGEGDVIDPCLNRAGVLEICGSCEISHYDDLQYAKFPDLYEPAGASLSRVVPAFSSGLETSGYLRGSGIKVGLLAFDNPYHHRAATQLATALKQYGLPLTDQGFVGESRSAQDYGPALAQLQNYELHFQTEGINRVVVLDESGAILGYGTTIADKQHWYPHWGVNSTSGPAALISSGTYVPESERAGLTVIGWVPGGDKGYGPGTINPPGLSRCLALLGKHRIFPSGNNATVAAGQYCDEFAFLESALKATAEVSVTGFRSGAASLGTSFASAVVYGTRWSLHRNDGSAVYRTSRWSDDCTCLHYVGPAGTF